MELIKNKENVLSELNNLVNEYGSGKLIAQRIDELIFSCFEGWCDANYCLTDYNSNLLTTAKAVRDVLYKIE